MSIPDQLSLFDLPASVPVQVELAQSIRSARSVDRTDPAKSKPSALSVRGQGLRFAFYGRVSTAEYQDPESSMGWQRDSALDLIGSVGQIVVEYFDVGCSRRLAWMDRPQARRLLEAIARPDREFDAIVVGEAERALCAGQLPAMTSTFVDHGVQVWLPELDRPVDPENPAHQAVVLQLGARSRREVVRAGSGPRPPCARRLVIKVVTSADAHLTATAWWTLVLTRIGHMLAGGDGYSAWIRILAPLRQSAGSSLSDATAAASAALPGPSTKRGCLAHRLRTPNATRTVTAGAGRRGDLRGHDPGKSPVHRLPGLEPAEHAACPGHRRRSQQHSRVRTTSRATVGTSRKTG